MWNLNHLALASMRQDIARLHTEGDLAAAEIWLVWAETFLNTLDVPGPPIHSTKKIFPLVVWLSRITGASPLVIRGALQETLPRILFQAKLAGRDLNVDDGHTAIRVIRSSLKEADG